MKVEAIIFSPWTEARNDGSIAGQRRPKVVDDYTCSARDVTAIQAVNSFASPEKVTAAVREHSDSGCAVHVEMEHDVYEAFILDPEYGLKCVYRYREVWPGKQWRILRGS